MITFLVCVGFVSGFLVLVLAVLLFPDYLPSRRERFMCGPDLADNATAAVNRGLVVIFVRTWKWLAVIAVCFMSLAWILGWRLPHGGAN